MTVTKLFILAAALFCLPGTDAWRNLALDGRRSERLQVPTPHTMALAMSTGKIDKSVDTSVFDIWFKKALTAMEKVNDPLVPVSIPIEFQSAHGTVGKSDEVAVSVKSFQNKYYDYTRLVSLAGSSYNVYNFCIFPNTSYDLPIFGADIVVLPGKVLASIDFQPLGKGAEYFDHSSIYAPYRQRLGKWQKVLSASSSSSSTVIPPAIQEYFSPLAVLTTFPPQNAAGSMALVGQALLEYLECYVDLTIKTEKDLDCSTVRSERDAATAEDHHHQQQQQQQQQRKDMLDQYLQFRIENDPAKKLLGVMFGEKWTQSFLRTAVFPTSSADPGSGQQ
mmetsp:Transcript_27069/g.45334  ORF Transcript_27069/g.45334 Transcript_27069/m.45334 type:complete len:334 (-) Transcript_27069:271-1272(-)